MAVTSVAQGGARGMVRTRRACVRGAGVLALALGLGGVVAGTSAGAALPDGRAYEQVSAAKKNGTEAGVTLVTQTGVINTTGAYGTAAPGGGAVAYWQEGPAAETFSGVDQFSVSRRNPQTGWETSAALPPEDLANGDFLGAIPKTLLPSADLSRFLFVAFGPFVKENSVSTGLKENNENLGLYRTRGNSIEPEWLTRPTFEKFSQAKPEPGKITYTLEGVYPVGGSADLSTVYFTYFGTLVPQDKTRAPLVEPIEYPLWSSTEAYKELARVVEANGEQFHSCANNNINHKPSETDGEKLEGEVTEKSQVVRGLSSTANITFGEAVTGAKIKAGTTVKEVLSGTEVELSTAVEGAETKTVTEPLTFFSRCGPSGVWWEKETTSGELSNEGPWGFYEWHDGELRSAGELPDGTFSRFGAVPAVTGTSAYGTLKFPFARFTSNEVSQDGSRAFFLSPAPRRLESLRCGGLCEAGTPVELYVREQTTAGPKTVLVSRDELEAGKPAPAPECTKGASFAACGETAVTPVKTQNAPEAYVYGSPDGSRAFFESKDKLAKDASGMIEPTGSGPWTYEFNVEAEGGKGKVTYLPGVVGPIAASSQDGSRFIFKNTSTKKIELWTGGSAPVEVASFATPAEPEFEGVATKDGAVFVVDTNAALTHELQKFNNSEHQLQAYRYEVSSQRLSCASCAPQGVPQQPIDVGNRAAGAAREIADEGRRVFFGTAATLLPQAENGVEGVYEWEQAGTGSCLSEEKEGGCVYLLSSGTSPDPSFYLDNDESGENVFFATKAGLVKGDTDESYDVYDARVGGGFREPPPPAECAETCRSPGAAPTLPAGLSNALGTPENTTRITKEEESGGLGSKQEKPLTRAQKLAKALKACAKEPKRKRAACRKRARRLYGAKATSKRHAGRRRR